MDDSQDRCTGTRTSHQEGLNCQSPCQWVQQHTTSESDQAGHLWGTGQADWGIDQIACHGPHRAARNCFVVRRMEDVCVDRKHLFACLGLTGAGNLGRWGFPFSFTAPGHTAMLQWTSKTFSDARMTPRPQISWVITAWRHSIIAVLHSHLYTQIHDCNRSYPGTVFTHAGPPPHFSPPPKNLKGGYSRGACRYFSA